MNITRRCDYACRILRAIYQHGDGQISVADIAKAEDIPYAFARSIQHDLTKGGLVKAIRGAHGGLVLARDLNKVTLYELIELIQGPVSVSICATDPEYCHKKSECTFHPIWHGANQLLDDYFSSITLAEALELGKNHPSVMGALVGAHKEQ